MTLHQPVFPSALYPNTPGDPIPETEPFYWQVPHLPGMDLPGALPELEGLAAFGQDPSAETDETPAAPLPPARDEGSSAGVMLNKFAPYAIVGLSTFASAYHGYKSSDRSVTAAVGWGLLGFFFPIVTPIFALTQGFAQPSETTLIRRMAFKQGVGDQPFPPYDPSKRILYNPIPRSGYKGSSFQ